MPKISPVQHNFTAGELSPFLHGRDDIAKYSNAAKTLKNILIHQAGAGQRRPGSKYVASVKTAGAKSRLITFEFSTTQTYIIELGNLYARFFRNNGQIDTTTMTITNATQANPCVVTMANHPFANGDLIVITGVVGMTELNGNTYTVANRADDTVELLGINSGGFGAYTSDGVATRAGVCEIITPYTTAQLFDLQFAQDADTMWIVHPSHKPQKLTRADHTEWTIDDYAPAGDVFTAANAYPSCVAMFEQRIWFANTNADPQKIWGSESGDFEVLTPGVNAGDPFVYVIASDKVNAIRWLKPTSKSLQLGTLGGTFSMSSGSDALAITPTNVSVKRDTTYGAAKILPEMIGGFVYYVERDLKHLRELGYSYDVETEQGQESLDMTILADHIAKATDPRDTDGFTQIAYQQSPVNRLWCIRDDGQLAVLTRQIDQEVIGWSRQVSGLDTRNSGKYESVAIIPTDAGDDEVWVIVRRYINGSIVRYVEYFMPETFDHQQDAFFVDSGLSLDTPKTITGIEAKKVIDDMEYASDAAAQIAYVSNDTAASYLINQPTSDSFLFIGFAGGNRQRIGQTFTLTDRTVISKVSLDFHTTVGTPTGNFTLRIEEVSGGLPTGVLAHANATKSIVPVASAWNDFDFTDFTLEAGTYCLRTVVDNQLNGVAWQIKHNNTSVYAGGNGVNSQDAGVVWNEDLTIDIAFRLYAPALQCYSESVIKEQGAYSLRVMANKTDSLNNTLTRTLGTNIDLTGINTLKLDIRSNRIGSNIKIGLHDSGGITSEFTPDIVAVNDNQTETIDISGVANVDKDDIESIIITILNADENTVFYLDNLYGVAAYIIVTSTTHTFVDGDQIKIVDVVGMTELNGNSYIVDRLTANTFALKDLGGVYIDGSAYTAYISGGEARKMVTLIEGLTHLVGETVAITADGLAVTVKVVSAAGKITLDQKASLVHAGLSYIADIALLPHPEGSETGTAIGKVQRIYKLIIKFYRSLGVQFGPDEDNLDTIEYTTLFTGDRLIEFQGDWDRLAGVLLRQANPLPLNILSVALISEVIDD